MGRPAEGELTSTWRARVVAALVPHVAHGVNNSLAVVMGMSDLLAHDGPGAEVRSHAQEVHDQAAAASRLLVGLSELASARAGRRPHDLGETLGRLELLFTSAAKAARHELRTARPACALPVDIDESAARLLGAILVWTILGGPEADRSRMAQRGPGRLRLAARVRGGRAVLTASSVRDEGAPAPELDDSALEAARTIAEAVGGRVRARVRGQTAVLSALLPACGLEDAGASGSRVAARIVVIEPDAVLGDLLGEVLGEAGHRVHLARCADSARRALEEPAALVLIDGFVRASAEELLHDLEVPVVTLGEGPAPALAKPLRPAELLARVRELLS